MARYCNDFLLNESPDSVFHAVQQYLLSEGYEYTQYENEPVFKKGKGVWTGPTFFKLSFYEGGVRLEAWMKYALLPGVYVGELGATGFVGAAAKGPLKRRIAQIETILSQYVHAQNPQPQAQPNAPTAAPSATVGVLPGAKHCTACGAALASDASFCTSCGQAVKPVSPPQPSAPVQPAAPVAPVQPVQPIMPAQHVQPAQPVQPPVQPVQPIQPAQPAPVYTPPVYQPAAPQPNAAPYMPPQPGPAEATPKAHQLLRSLATSPAFLIAVIATTLSFVLSIVNAALLPPRSLLDSEILSALGLEYVVNEYFASISVSTLVGTLLGSIPALLIVIGLWITVAAGRSREPGFKISGLTLIKVLQVIGIVLLSIAAVVALFFCVIFVIAIVNANGSPYADAALSAAVAMLLVVVILLVAAIICIVLEAKIIASLNAAKRAAVSGVAARKASSLIGVVAILQFVYNIIDCYGQFVTNGVCAGIAAICTGVAALCFAITIFRFNGAVNRLRNGGI